MVQIINIKNFIKFSAFITLIFSLILFAGCTNKANTEQNDQTNEISEISNVQENQTEPVPSSPKEERTVIMLGRSIMENWFLSWGWNNQDQMKNGRFTLKYKQLSPPPEIIRSVEDIMESLPAEKKDIIFFKLCFEDFVGGEDANENLERNKNYIEEVYDIVVKKHGAKLIIGNALPKVIYDTDIYLVWNHQQYNKWLKDFWKEHPDEVTIFNMYDILANDMGALNADYTDDPRDSHANNDAYKKLDDSFFDMLDNLY